MECLTHQVDITELVKPEVVDSGGGCGEVVVLESLVAQVDGVAESAQDPEVEKPLISRQLVQTHTQTDAKYSNKVMSRQLVQINTQRIPKLPLPIMSKFEKN